MNPRNRMKRLLRLSHRSNGIDSRGHNGRPYQPDQPTVTVRSLKSAGGERDGSNNRKIGDRVARRRGYPNYRALIADVARGLMRSGADRVVAVRMAIARLAGLKR